MSDRSLAKKAFILNDLFSSYEYDLVFLTETWIQAVFLTACPGPSVFQFPTDHRPGWKVKVCFQIHLLVSTVAVGLFFQALSYLHLFCDAPILCTLVYPPTQFNNNFIHLLKDFIIELPVNDQSCVPFF